MRLPFTPQRLVILIAGLVVVAGLSTGIYFAVRSSGDGEAPQVVAEPTEIATASLLTATPPLANPSPSPQPLAATPPTTTHSVPPPPAPTSTATGPQDPTPGPSGPIAALPTLAQIQMAGDGTYFVADRGDGCPWEEFYRSPNPDLGVEVFFRTDCEVDFAFLFRPATGEIVALLP